ncbi:hypothetical protein C2S51_032929 [Perilla frutescens var. frutescens]|nr:hypothetical protein C2S51_032929 [Perilla frutescens var. frutescens]
MESRSPVSRYVSRNSEKRAFPSSAVLKDVEVLEIPPPPPPSNRSSKLNSSKQKEVISHEIIDVDIEEDRGIDGHSKGKVICHGIIDVDSEELDDGDVLILDGISKDKGGGDVTSSSSSEIGPSSRKRPRMNSSFHTDVNNDINYPNVLFKKFDIVEDYFDHRFAERPCSANLEVQCRSGGGPLEHPAVSEENICLSLLNGDRSFRVHGTWIRGVSTMLQVLVTFQGLVLTAKPYFQEREKLERYEKLSLLYNEKVFMRKLEMMIHNMRCPPKHFEEYVVGHFRRRAREILVSCKTHLDGASSSLGFKYQLASFMTTLVDAFSRIGAEDCRRFLYF